MYADRALHNIFIDEGYVTAEVIEKVLAERENSSEPLGESLFSLGYVTLPQKMKCVALQTGIPFIDVKTTEIDSQLAKRIPQKLAMRWKALLVDSSETAASVAMADPMNFDLIDELSHLLGLDIDPMWAIEADLVERIVEIYGGYNDLEDILGAASKEVETSGLELSQGSEEDHDKVVSLADVSDGSPVVQFVNGLFARAIKFRASDIHIEPRAKSVRVRFRVDGMLRDIMDVPREIHRAVVSRIKVISGLDIAERRIPQDGRCSMVSAEGDFDFRIATYPTVNGEKVTVRVLDKRSGIREVQSLGIANLALQELLHSVEQSQGLVLVTGPTGSGKTTTLYSLLNHVNRGDRQVITIEDPVEYQMEGIVQANVNVLAGLTFATGLRAMLRERREHHHA
nr:Flp pilus assembly complex ATPase component TadA [Fimbriimonadaceae bacterium]